MSSAMMKFSDLIRVVNKELTKEAVNNAKNMIAGDGKSNLGMVGCIEMMVSSLSNIGAWAAVKMAIISLTLNPLFTSLSSFVDII